MIYTLSGSLEAETAYHVQETETKKYSYNLTEAESGSR